MNATHAMNAMNNPDCLLTLTLPCTLEEEVLDTLIANPDLARGFTVMQAQGMGVNIELASAMEQVQGRAKRVLVQVAMEQSQVETLIRTLQETLQSPQVAYWVVPLLTFGRLGK